MNIKYVIASTLFSLSLSVYGQSGVSVKSINKAGILSEQFQGESLERIKILKLKGIINKQDIKFLVNEMRVTDLDLSEATFDSTIGKDGIFPGYLLERLAPSLQSLTLPKNITHIADNAFSDMIKLERISFRNKIYSVGKNAFRNCGRLKLQGDEFVAATLIDDYAFYDCKSIHSIKLGKELNKLGLKVFWGCKSLTQVTIDPANEELLFFPEGLFYQCSNLMSVDVPLLIKSIDKSSFSGCDLLETVNLRTIVPPMLADNAFDEYLHPMVVVVSPRSINLYKKSSNWRKFRGYFTTSASTKVYDRTAGEDDKRIEATVIKKEESVVAAKADGKDKVDSILIAPISYTELGNNKLKDSKGKDKSSVVVALSVKAVEPKAKEKRESEKPDTTQVPDLSSKPVKEEKKNANEVTIVKEHGSRTPVISVPKNKTQATREEVDPFRAALEQVSAVPDSKPKKYFNSDIVNTTVSELTLYVKSGLVYIEAPAKIVQLTIIDKLGRTIYASKQSDTLYNTTIEASSVKLIRAVYEGGIETKRY